MKKKQKAVVKKSNEKKRRKKQEKEATRLTVERRIEEEQEAIEKGLKAMEELEVNIDFKNAKDDQKRYILKRLGVIAEDKKEGRIDFYKGVWYRNDLTVNSSVDLNILTELDKIENPERYAPNTLDVKVINFTEEEAEEGIDLG